ncbi:hypothetical protein OG909_23835 [Streptomyces sp. NBC_01754]|uniref:hypothetical protein n=1 Tax=Streptomyces sp. NBC_01754 TaxID=2975930 RepID=UPI002DD847FE|nr:hypothetical protein [Streptomyces sp. NBC_01754]WSC95063.1 hypothetical protein OG909_23835 [Streptomyces sp. NBC_01754]
MRFGRTATAAAFAMFFTIVTVPTADAATASTACGSGYSRVGHYPITSSMAQAKNPGGYLDIYYSSSTGKNCGVAYPTSTHQGKTSMLEVDMRKSGNSTWTGDSGNFTYYAGPVYVSARGACIDALGFVTDGYDYRGGFYGKHCG